MSREHEIEATKRWPNLNRKERERGAFFIRRLAHLKTRLGTTQGNDWLKAEIGAIEWILTLIDDYNDDEYWGEDDGDDRG